MARSDNWIRHKITSLFYLMLRRTLHTEFSALDQLNGKPGEYAAHTLDDAQARITKERDLAIPGNKLSAPGQVGREEKFVSSNDSASLDRTEGEMVLSSTEEVDREATESNIHKVDLGLTEETSFNDLEEGNIVTSALTENNEGSSSYFESETECKESDKGHSLDRLKDHDTDVVAYSTHSEEDLQGKSHVLSPATQEKSQNETETIEFEAEVGQLEEDMMLPAGSPATDVVSLESQITEELPSGDGSAEEALHVSIPEIIVSSFVLTDDEGSDAGSTFEGDTNNVQRKVEDETERQNIDDKQSDVGSSREASRSHQEKDGHVSDTATYTDQIKENTFPKQEGGISRKYHEINLLPFRGTANFSASKKASTSEKPGKEATVTDQSGRTVSSEIVHVANLGERASSLLSQLRSEISSMKTARLSNASPIEVADSAGDTSEESQQRDTSQPASQERDSSQPGAVSAATYRLPLFEDVDSACSSFSLDDFLSDPVTQEALSFASETYHVNIGTGDY